MADGNWPVLRYDDHEYELAHTDDHSDPLVCVLSESIDMQMIIEQGLNQEEEIYKHRLDTKELQDSLEMVGLHPIMVDENTDFNSPEFRKLGRLNAGN